LADVIPPGAQRAGGWRRVDSAGSGLAVDLGLYALSAAFAAATAATSTLLPHRAWGMVAVWGYAAATLTVLTQFLFRAHGIRTRAGLTWLAWAATALLPLVIQAAQRAGGRTDRAQEEVIVVEHAGQRLLDHGTPYLGRDAIAALPEADRLLGYTPYQPGMALFGLPRAAAGDAWWTDARVWFAVVTAAALIAATRRLTGRVRPIQAATVLPICALTLATGGDDLPVLALCLLALTLCAGERYAAAGLSIGAAGAAKLFAWPVTLVLLVHVLTRGRSATTRFAAGAIGLPVAALIPPALVDWGALVENVIRFPLGQGLVGSPAQSPFPGHLIAEAVPGGRTIAAVLLAAAGLSIAVALLRRPPRTATAAAFFCGYGLLAAILLMPSTRFGYLLYPAAFLIWAPALADLSQDHMAGSGNRARGVHLEV
jgi:Glycosyltransferase family 87